MSTATKEPETVEAEVVKEEAKPAQTRALARRAKAGALVQDRITWTDDQVALIQRTVAKGTTPDEFKLFLYQCARTGLDPLAKQIYAIKRWNAREGREVMGIQTGIDGFRVVAERTGAYAGSDDAVFAGATPVPGMTHGAAEKLDLRATVTVYKIVKNVRCPFTATAYWQEYYPGEKQGAMWRNKPHIMLAKCAEALALRKAFPADLSGVYTHEEMEQAGTVVEVEPTKTASAPAPEPQAEPAQEPPPAEPQISPLPGPYIEKAEMSLLFGTAKSYGIAKKDDIYPIASKALGVDIKSVKQIPKNRLDDVIREITGEPKKGA